MKNKIFNTKYEVEPRIVLLAASFPGYWFSADQLLAFDFMTVYSKEFGRGGENLHGDSGFKYSELSARKQSLDEALKDLVLSGLMIVRAERGFQYCISENGIRYAQSFHSTYAQEYQMSCREMGSLYLEYDEQSLMKMIQGKALNSRTEDDW